MSSIGTSLKREAVTQGWIFIIENATGQNPVVERSASGNSISFRPGQARLFEQYLNKAISTEPEYDPDGINVDVALMPVLMPLLIKKTIGWVVAYTALAVIAGRYIWKR